MEKTTFRGVFTRLGHTKTRATFQTGYKTTQADVTTWRGVLDGTRITLRVTVRALVAGENFLTTSGHRLRSSHVGRGGHFPEVLDGPSTGPIADKVQKLIEAEEDLEVNPRGVRLRVRGERLPRVLGQDIGESTCGVHS